MRANAPVPRGYYSRTRANVGSGARANPPNPPHIRARYARCASALLGSGTHAPERAYAAVGPPSSLGFLLSAEQFFACGSTWPSRPVWATYRFAGEPEARKCPIRGERRRPAYIRKE
jgi:hypothetical protein